MTRGKSVRWAPDSSDSPTPSASSWRTVSAICSGVWCKPGVDDLEPVIAKRSRDGLGTAVVAIKAGLRDDDSVGAFHEPQTLRNRPTISPTAASMPRDAASIATARQRPRALPEWWTCPPLPDSPSSAPPSPEQSSRSSAACCSSCVLGLITWGIAAFLSSGEHRDHRQPRTPASRTRLRRRSARNDVAEAGPLLFAELSTITGARSLVVDHEGDDPANGWRLYYAFPPGSTGLSRSSRCAELRRSSTATATNST